MGNKGTFVSVIVGILIIGSLSFVGQNSAYAGVTLQITCPPDLILEAGDDTNPPATGVPDVTDDNPTITFSDVVSGSNPVIIERTWTATDDSGNTASCVQTITVNDTTAPVITCPGDMFLEAPADTSPANTGEATATDAGDPNPTITFLDAVSGSNPVIIERTWRATDVTGNFSECVQTITVTTPEVEIDIKPGSDPNSINVKSKGLLPVVIFGSPEFDVTQIDTTTVDFDILDVNGSTIATKCIIEDVDGDGIDDMVCFFKIKDIQHKCTAEFVVGQIQVQLLDGTPFRGLDDVRWVNCKHFDP